tara:strand:+ start:228 stop:674 length:447 start_codon:yes stop_codon:yes gene_type:complete
MHQKMPLFWTHPCLVLVRNICELPNIRGPNFYHRTLPLLAVPTPQNAGKPMKKLGNTARHTAGKNCGKKRRKKNSSFLAPYFGETLISDPVRRLEIYRGKETRISPDMFLALAKYEGALARDRQFVRISEQTVQIMPWSFLIVCTSRI